MGVVDQEVLLGDQVLATASDGDLSFDLIPADWMAWHRAARTP